MTRNSSRATARAAADRAHARAVAPTAPHAWSWWMLIAAGAGLLSITVGSVPLDEFLTGRALLLGEALSVVVTISLFYWVSLGAARSALSQRPLRETLQWLRGERPVQVWGSTSVIALVIFLVSGLLGALVSPLGLQAVLIICTMIAVGRALSLAHRDHAVSFSMSPSERRRYEEQVAQERSRRLSRLTSVFKPRFMRADGRERMGMPLLQTFLVVYGPTFLWSMALGSLSGGEAPQWAYDVAVLPMMVVAVRGWAWWGQVDGLRGVIGMLKRVIIRTA